MQRQPRKQEKQNNGAMVYRKHDEIPRRKCACGAEGVQNAEGFMLYGIALGNSPVTG
jgi:hypothetical protein